MAGYCVWMEDVIPASGPQKRPFLSLLWHLHSEGVARSPGPFPLTQPAGSNNSWFPGCISLYAERPNLRVLRQLLSLYYNSYKYFALRELKFPALTPDVPGGYVVADCDDKFSLNVLIIPVDSNQSCSPRSNLDLVNHVWDTYMFSFYK